MFLVVLLIILLAFAPMAQAVEPAAPLPGPVLQQSTPITAGAVLREYRWTTGDGPANIYVIQVDLNNPYVQLGVIPGAGKLTQRLNVSAMAKQTGAVAAVNADFYNTQAEGSPIGPTVINQQLVTSPCKLEGIYALGLTTDRQAYIDEFTFEGRVTAPNGEVFELSGLNKAIYWEEPGSMHSHAHKLHLYNDMWGGSTRGNDSYTIPTEMLVAGGRVLNIVSGQYIDGPVPAGMQILRAHGAAARFLLDNFSPGDPVEITYTNNPHRNWSMVVGGHALLVDQGAVVPYTKDISALGGVRARTAAGISRDGKTIWLVGVEGRTAASKGLTLPNLSRFMVEIGVWRALNLDGGGSTTMVARPLGAWEAQRVFTTEQLTERLVVNALGIYTSAPKGSLKGLALQGVDLLLVNEQVPLTLKAYDQYYNPLDPGGLPVQWKVSGNSGTVEGGTFKALSPGLVEIAAGAGSVSTVVTAKIAGKQDVTEMKLTTTTPGQVVKGEQVPLQLSLTTVAGKTRKVPASLVSWQFYGLGGQVSPQGTLTILDSDGTGPGFVVARYQGFSAPLPLQTGADKELPALNNLQDLSFQSQPAEVLGQVSMVASPPGGSSGPAARLDYDFTATQGTAAAYVKLGSAGMPINERPLSLMLDVYGDNGSQWLRAEVVDAAENLHRLDLSTAVNWSGWRTLQLQLADPAMVFPVTLKRLYVVSLEGQQGTRAPKGTLLFKDLRLKYAGVEPVVQAPARVSLELTVGQKQLLVNGSPQEMDVAPVIRDGRTLVPVRFISQALDAPVLWGGATKNVTVVQGRHWIDLWLGEDLMVVDGRAVALDVPPVTIQGRTMLPLSAVARALGLTVDWDPETRKIRLN